MMGIKNYLIIKFFFCLYRTKLWPLQLRVVKSVQTIRQTCPHPPFIYAAQNSRQVTSGVINTEQDPQGNKVTVMDIFGCCWLQNLIDTTRATGFSTCWSERSVLVCVCVCQWVLWEQTVAVWQFSVGGCVMMNPQSQCESLQYDKEASLTFLFFICAYW